MQRAEAVALRESSEQVKLAFHEQLQSVELKYAALKVRWCCLVY